jgi:hypothetical protein
LPIFRRHHTNAVLVSILCGCRFGLFSGWGETETAHIYNHTQHSPKLRLCSAFWRCASDARNMSRLWTRIKVKVKVKCVSSWLCLLRYYEARSTKHYIQRCFKIPSMFISQAANFEKLDANFNTSIFNVLQACLFSTSNAVRFFLSVLFYFHCALSTDHPSSINDPGYRVWDQFISVQVGIFFNIILYCNIVVLCKTWKWL